MLKEKIRMAAAAYLSDGIAYRRHLHAFPELSYQEFETSAFIQDRLREFGIPFRVIAETGVVGLIEGRNPTTRFVALRADMDALPIEEKNDIPYRSQRPGVMHACGHDVHTSCLLGAAHILQSLASEWEGSVRLIFQPGEEKNPGGASLMIREGVLEDPTPSAIFGLHVHPFLETGRFSFRAGKVMASADEIYITVKGKGGHAASPDTTTDIILVTAHLITALQQIVSRNSNPFSPSVLSICSVQGGHTTNVIPTEVHLMGTFRTMDESWRFRAHELIERQVWQIASAMGATADVRIDVGYPNVYNNESLHDNAMALAIDYAGHDKIGETELRMGAEDFGYYSQQIPGCFFRLGTGFTDGRQSSGVHTPTFNVDEQAIEYGAGMMAWLGAKATLTQ